MFPVQIPSPQPSLRLRAEGPTLARRRFSGPTYAFQTCPGLVFIVTMALRVSTMHGDQSASS